MSLPRSGPACRYADLIAQRPQQARDQFLHVRRSRVPRRASFVQLAGPSLDVPKDIFFCGFDLFVRISLLLAGSWEGHSALYICKNLIGNHKKR